MPIKHQNALYFSKIFEYFEIQLVFIRTYKYFCSSKLERMTSKYTDIVAVVMAGGKSLRMG